MSQQPLPAAPQAAPLPLKERQRRERAELILEAAEAVLAERGYHETSMDEIAARVGIAKGTVYLHYPSKDDLVVALFERELATFRQVVDDAMRAPGTVFERIEIILRHAYADLRGRRTRLFLTLSTSIAVRSGLIEQRAPLRDHMAYITDRLRTLLDAGKTSGELDTSIPTPVMLTTFLALLSRRSAEHLASEEELAPEDVVQAISRIFFHGIARAAH